MAMTSRERVLAAINHQEPDRVPIVMGVSNATGIKMPPYQGLKRILDIDAPDDYIYDWPQLGTAKPDEQTMLRLHSDVRGVLDRHPDSTILANQQSERKDLFCDSWGIGQIEIKPGVWFPGHHPMKEATTIEDIEAYPWPDPFDPSRIAHVRAQAAQLAAENQYAIMGTPWLLFPFERAIGLQGMEGFLKNMAKHRDFAKDLLHQITALCKDLMITFLDEIGDNIDIIKIGDDLGTQHSLMISPKMYREIIKPLHADLIQTIKARTDAKILFHTDGDVFPLMDDLIEIGIDILNPIQTSAGKMANLAELKERYGKQLVLCGAIDTHQVLPMGTPEEVRQEVKRVIEALGPGGGYLLSSVHTITDEVPPENILAMVDAAVEFGHYPIK